MLDKLRQFIQSALAAHRLNKALAIENAKLKSLNGILESEHTEAERIIDEAMDELNS